MVEHADADTGRQLHARGQLNTTPTPAALSVADSFRRSTTQCDLTLAAEYIRPEYEYTSGWVQCSASGAHSALEAPHSANTATSESAVRYRRGLALMQQHLQVLVGVRDTEARAELQGHGDLTHDLVHGDTRKHGPALSPLTCRHAIDPMEMRE